MTEPFAVDQVYLRLAIMPQKFTAVTLEWIFFILSLLVRLEWGGWWRWALVSPDGVAPSWMVGVSASVNLPLHHKVQKFSSGTSSPRWSRKKGRKTVVVVVVCWSNLHSPAVFLTSAYLYQAFIESYCCTLYRLWMQQWRPVVMKLCSQTLRWSWRMSPMNVRFSYTLILTVSALVFSVASLFPLTLRGPCAHQRSGDLRNAAQQ